MNEKISPWDIPDEIRESEIPYDIIKAIGNCKNTVNLDDFFDDIKDKTEDNK